jgi:phosphate transport system permease protein
MLLVRGGTRLFGADFVEVLTELPPAGFEMGGGIGPAIVGTFMVGIATLISVPFGILAAIYLAMLDPDSKLATTSRFLAKVLTGFPVHPGRCLRLRGAGDQLRLLGLAGGVALAVLMLPTVVLAAEEAIKQVPQRMKDAAYGMGCTRTQVIWKVVLPTGCPAS